MGSAFWFAQPLLELAVLAAMSRRGLLRRYPYFSAYLILQVLTKAFLMAFRHSQAIYFFGYYLTLGFTIILSAVVLWELFREVFRPHEILLDFNKPLLQWVGLASLLLAVVWTVTSINHLDARTVVGAIYPANRSLRLMQFGMAFFLLLFSEQLGISGKSISFGIAMGFGLFAGFDLLVSVGLSHQSVVPTFLIKRLDLIAYLVAILIWLTYAAAPTTLDRRTV